MAHSNRNQARFEGLEPDPSWAFWHLTQAQTSYVTHGYHRYPAKFIPQLAARLITEYSSEGELVVDPFMGSGTTLVEAKLLKRPSIGVDINPVAYWVAQAKVNAIEPTRLKEATEQLYARLESPRQPSLFSEWRLEGEPPGEPNRIAKWRIGDWRASLLEGEALEGEPPGEPITERLNYWFPPQSLAALMHIHAAIETLDDDLKPFFRCALSHSLKPLSWWSDRSVKPTRQLNKPIPDAYTLFFRHVSRMRKGNQAFWQLLLERNAFWVPAVPHCADARQLPIGDGEASLIVTSPPYVTSYEYADLHQLSALWFGATTDLREFRKGFIGRSNGIEAVGGPTDSALAEQIVAEVQTRAPRKAKEVALYFAEMRQCFEEMRRVLRRGGHLCIVIGNTHLQGVEIQNAQVFAEQLTALDFKLERVILREIPSKILPRTRDKQTGKFAKTSAADYLAYPTEYILVLQKC